MSNYADSHVIKLETKTHEPVTHEPKKLFSYCEYLAIFFFCVISVIFSFVDVTPGNQLSLIDLSDNITWQKIVYLFSGIASFTGALSVVLASKEHSYTYIFGIVNCITFGLYAFAYGYAGTFQLNIMYFLPLQFHGFYKWNKEIDLEVKALTIIEKVKYTYLCFVFWYIFYFEIPGFTKFVTQQEYPYETNILARVLDSGGTSLSIIAQYLLINKYYESWILWTVVNVFQIIMFSGINDFISLNIIIMTCIYQLNAFYGFYLWTRKFNSVDLSDHGDRVERIERVDRAELVELVNKV
jgi:nicotinamide mononucleotide transporter